MFLLNEVKMRKRQIFYVFDEHTDYIAECEKLGFVPVKYDGCFVKQFELNGKRYDVLGRNECYSGWEINIVQEGIDEFDELMFMLLNSHTYDERVVSIGLMLKNYYDCFLSELTKKSPQDKSKKKLVKLITKNICKNSYDVSNMKELIEICKSM